VLATAAEFVAATGAQPTALLVLPEDPTGGDLDGLWSNPLAGRITDALSRFRVLQRAGVLKVRRGPPVREVLGALEEISADAMVLGVRRGGPAGELGSGHVGRDLLQSAPSAILSVPI
jgi:nucleotide-binding universal stress UspA family protein